MSARLRHRPWWHNCAELGHLFNQVDFTIRMFRCGYCWVATSYHGTIEVQMPKFRRILHGITG